MKSKLDMGRREHVWRCRWQARTDLLWLCREVLNYKLMDDNIHGPVARHLQQFPLPDLDTARNLDRLMPDGNFLYVPTTDPYTTLQGPRYRALFDSRGYFKTSLNTIAHSIQWLLNYPHRALMLLFASGERSEDVMRAIKDHFRTNRNLRDLFPEYCPQKRIADWGTASDFTLPNRARVLELLSLPPRVESSLMAQSLDKGQIGYHVDCIKCSDVVEPGNCLTPAQRYQVKYRFGLVPKLLVNRPDGTGGWIDIEGTFYHPSDLHVDMVNAWKGQTPEQRRWSIFLRGVYQRDTGTEPPKFLPTEMDLPFRRAVDGNRIPTWPAMDPLEKLVKEEADPLEGGRVFASQRLLDLRADSSSNRPFQAGPIWKKREDYAHIPIAYRVVSCDLADTDGVTSNASAIVVAAVDRAGRTYIEDIQLGKWGPEDTVNRIISTFLTYQDKSLRTVIVEDYAYTHGLAPTFTRALYLEGIRLGLGDSLHVPFDFVKPDRTKKKVERIVNALQSPYNNGDLMFVEPFASGGTIDPEVFKKVKSTLDDEFRDCTSFSTGTSDDLLDAIAYVFLRREHYGAESFREGGTRSPEEILRTQRLQQEKALRKMLFPDALAPEPDEYSRVTGW